MLETSKDILWVALALSIVVFTGFLSWAVYQVGRLLKQSNEIVNDVRSKLTKISNIISSIGEKVNHSASTLTTVAHGVEQVLSYVKTKRTKRKRRTTE